MLIGLLDLLETGLENGGEVGEVGEDDDMSS